ncbi:MAG: hypothetical protein Q9160_006196 [Pyrenula sp. 1 TL-2023]
MSDSDECSVISRCSISSKRDTLEVLFIDESEFIFHSQWLYDARCDRGASRDAATVFCQQLKSKFIQDTKISETGIRTSLDVTWTDKETCKFPAVWLQLLAPRVAKELRASRLSGESSSNPKGHWLASTLTVPEIPYEQVFGSQSQEIKSHMLTVLLQPTSLGILKITSLPAVSPATEDTQRNNLVTSILKHLFGSVFQHPSRGPDETFKIASTYSSYSKNQSPERITDLPNYDTSETLLPHTDHAHYENPVRVQAFHAIQGTSENTFIDGFAALHTLRQEFPDLYEAFCTNPQVLGRVAQFYDPPLCQTTVDTAVRRKPGSGPGSADNSTNEVKCLRYHPHLAGYLLAPYDSYSRARLAHTTFQSILRRPSHQYCTALRPGDLYVWDNFRILHGRERILETPRLAVGQTVIEQVVVDEWRRVCMRELEGLIGEGWLVQCPGEELGRLVEVCRELKEKEGEIGAGNRSCSEMMQ